ncbi:hypothetical protein EV714DRAFT_277809 [Schizophyllum commune]
MDSATSAFHDRASSNSGQLCPLPRSSADEQDVLTDALVIFPTAISWRRYTLSRLTPRPQHEEQWSSANPRGYRQRGSPLWRSLGTSESAEACARISGDICDAGGLPLTVESLNQQFLRVSAAPQPPEARVWSFGGDARRVEHPPLPLVLAKCRETLDPISESVCTDREPPEAHPGFLGEARDEGGFSSFPSRRARMPYLFKGEMEAWDALHAPGSPMHVFVTSVNAVAAAGGMRGPPRDGSLMETGAPTLHATNPEHAGNVECEKEGDGVSDVGGEGHDGELWSPEARTRFLADVCDEGDYSAEPRPPKARAGSLGHICDEGGKPPPPPSPPPLLQRGDIPAPQGQVSSRRQAAGVTHETPSNKNTARVACEGQSVRLGIARGCKPLTQAVGAVDGAPVGRGDGGGVGYEGKVGRASADKRGSWDGADGE